jgi:hypothetical protein
MSQLGTNAGPHHAIIYGNAKSICNKESYSDAKVFCKDSNTLGILTFAYNKFLTYTPLEIVKEHQKQLADAGLELMSTDNIPEGNFASLRWPPAKRL